MPMTTLRWKKSAVVAVKALALALALATASLSAMCQRQRRGMCYLLEVSRWRRAFLCAFPFRL